MNNEWKSIKLGDICSIKGGKRLPKGSSLTTDKTKHPYVRIRDMYQHKYIENNGELEFVDEDTFKTISNYIVNSGDVIIAIVGNTIGLVSLIGKSLDNASLTENCVKLINLDGCLSEYIYYYLNSEKGQNHIKSKIVGTSQPKLPIYGVKDIEIALPKLDEQKKIIDILSSLDKKIETNNKINKKLEEMAQAIFKQWFVDFEFPNENGEPFKSSGGEMVESELGIIPKAWKLKKLSELADMKNGVNYGRDQEGEPVKVINVRDFDGSLLVNDDKLDSIYIPQKQINDYKLQKLDTIIVRSAKPGETLLVNDDKLKVYSGFTIRIRPQKNINKIYIFYCVRNSIRKLENSSNGTIFKNLNQQLLGGLDIIEPPIEILDSYNKLIKSLIDKIYFTKQEVNKLIQVRDTLVPKLMSGEIRVPVKQ